jgi:flagellar biosynthesis chaperone FliJ
VAVILDKITELMARKELSSQVKPRDELTVHNSVRLQLIGEAVSQLKQLSPQNHEYSQVSITVGSALASTGDLKQSEQLFLQAIDYAINDADKALDYFNLSRHTKVF